MTKRTKLSEFKHFNKLADEWWLESGKYKFRDLIARGALDIAQPDVGRVGGISEWMKVAHLAHSFNLLVAPHAYQSIHLHLACATPNLKVV